MVAHLSLVKMQGLGNDFVMIDGRTLPAFAADADLAPLAVAVCNRYTGLGADGLIVALPSPLAGHDARFIYLNSDGSVGEMCGNGIRCFAQFVRHIGLAPADALTIDTLAGTIRPTHLPDGRVQVSMGAPILEPALIPFAPPNAPHGDPAFYSLAMDVGLPPHVSYDLKVAAVSMGNPHCIIWQHVQPEEYSLDPATVGPQVETHQDFPKKTNVEFAELVSPTHARLVVWERGCGLTQACGTGACATVVSGINAGFLTANTPVTVTLPGGDLSIQWSGNPADAVEMTGPAAISYTATLHPDTSLGQVVASTLAQLSSPVDAKVLVSCD